MPKNPEQPLEWVGQELADGRYVVLSLLGSGGMADVYRAFDRQTNTEMAIKVPKAILVADSHFGKRFEREVKFLAKLRHPHIVPLTDAGVHNEFPFAVFRYLAGGTLKTRLHGDDSMMHGKTLRESLQWLPQVASALDFLHNANILHRDVKPENIYFDLHGNAYLGDFGVIRSLQPEDEEEQATALTAPNTVLGTCAYMSPELIMGQTPYSAGVDQYSLAVTVYEALCGSRPFEGPPQQVMIQHMQATPQALHERRPELPIALSNAVQRALSKNANERFPSCTEFAQAVIGGADTLTPTVSETRADIFAPKPLPTFGAPSTVDESAIAKPPSRRRWLLPVGATFALVLMVAGWFAAARMWDNGAEKQRSENGSTIAKGNPRASKEDETPKKGDGQPKKNEPPKNIALPKLQPDDRGKVTAVSRTKKTKVKEVAKPEITPKPKPPVATVPPPEKRITVGNDRDATFRTLADAIAKSDKGDRIYVKPGVYHESIVLRKNLHLIGEGDAAGIIIESLDGSCVVMKTDEAAIHGITLKCRGPKNEKRGAVDIEQGVLHLERCLISADHGVAVRVHGDNADTVMKQCTVRDSVIGISLSDNAKATIEKTDIVANSTCGALVKTGADPLFVDCNWSGDNVTTAVLIDERGKGRFHQCNLFGKFEYGFEVGGASNPTLNACKIGHCQASSVYIHTGGNGMFEKCEITGAGRSAIDVYNGNPTFRKCVISKSDYIGIEIGPNGKGNFIECDVLNTAVSGIDVQGDPTFRECNIRNGGGHGLFVYPFGKGLYNACVFDGHSKSNVVSHSARDPYFIGCEMSKAKENGVVIAGSGKLDTCNVKNNGGHGIDIQKTVLSKRAYVLSCNVNNNTQAGVMVQGSALATVTRSNFAGNQRPTSFKNEKNVSLDGNTYGAE